MRLVRTLCVGLVLLLAAVHGSAARAAEVPQEAVLVVEIGAPQAAWDGLSAMAVTIEPSAVLPPLSQMIAARVGPQAAQAVDLDSPLQLILLAPPLHTSPVVVLGVQSPETLLGALGLPTEKVRDVGDVGVYNAAGREAAIATVDGHTVVGENVEAVGQVLAAMKAGRWPLGTVSGEQDLGLVVRPLALLEGLAQSGEDPFRTIEQELRTQSQRENAELTPELMTVLQAEIDAVEAMLRQTEEVRVGVAFNSEDLRVHKTVKLTPGGIATYLAGLPDGPLSLQTYLPADCLAGAVGKVGDLEPALDWYDDFIAKTMSALGGDRASVDALMELMRQGIEDLGGEMVQAVTTTAGGKIGYVYVMRTTDPAAFRQMLESMPDMLGKTAVFPFMDCSITVGPEPVRYKGQAITQWDYDIEFQPMGNMPQAEELAEMQQRMLDMFYGKDAQAYWTFLDDLCLLTYGEGALDEMKALIDGTDSLVESGKLRAALGEAMGDADVVGYVSLSEAVDVYLDILRVAMKDAPFPIPEMEFPEAPGVGFRGRMAAEHEVELFMRVPTASVRALVEGFKAAFMQMTVQPVGETAAMTEARIQARQAAGRHNLHSIGLGIAMWRISNDENYPPDLESIVESELIEDREVFIDPGDDSPRTVGSSGLMTSYEYVGSIPKNVPSDVIIAYSRKGIWPEGRNVLYVDMAVQFLTEEELHGGQPGARKTLEQCYQAVVDAYGDDITPEIRARLQKFYEVSE